LRCDVAIIGGGLTGCASAYYLRKAGASVVLLEAGELNGGASGRNAGSLHFQLEHRHVAHEERLAKSLEHLVRLSRVAIDQWRGLQDELGEDLELAMHGGLMVAETDDQVAQLKRKALVEAKHGLETQLLDGAEVRRIAPYLSERVQAASLCRDEGHCNPRLLTPAFARKSAALGATLLTRTRVNSIERLGDLWSIEVSQDDGTAREPLIADAVLNAAGAAAGEIAQLANYHLPIFPVGLLMNVTEKVGPCIEHLIQHVGRRISMKQTHDGNIMIGGGWSVRMRRSEDGSSRYAPGTPDIETVRGNLRIATELAPMIADTHLIRTWSGIAAVTTDQLPIIGELGKSRFFVAGGGSGFTFGPTYARLISEQIVTGRADASLEPYSPARFDHINMFMG
jgi:sarcosine oxidase, subunit beta